MGGGEGRVDSGRREGGRERNGKTYVDCRAGGLDNRHEERELVRGVSGGSNSAGFGRPGGNL